MAGHAQRRQAWLQENTHFLHQYSDVTEELTHRINARIAAYEIDPPGDLIAALGTKPATPQEQNKWSRAIKAYAQARLTLGPETDLSDPAVLEAVGWRNSVSFHHTTDQPARAVVLIRAG